MCIPRSLPNLAQIRACVKPQGAKHIFGRSITQYSCHQYTSIVKGMIAIAVLFSVLPDPTKAPNQRRHESLDEDRGIATIRCIWLLGIHQFTNFVAGIMQNK